MKYNVIEAIVQHNLCIGCGVCAGICPGNVLKMEFNVYGEYNPVMISNCIRNCNLCLKVCPFGENEENEDTLAKEMFGNVDGIKYCPETGFYLDSFVGYSNVNNHRANGASGGMATWLLETLLEKNIVDYVVCVTPYDAPNKLFRFAIFDKIESIRRSAKSAYYPVELSEIIKQIIKKEGRYVITGLPCFIKGLRLIQKKNKRLQQRIILTVGIVCGQMKSKHYTTFLASLAGIDKRLKYAIYRGKCSETPASNYYFTCGDEENNIGKKIFFNQEIVEIWVHRWFTPNACNFCDDVFAELSDVTVMDAWLPKYSKDSKGTNLVIVRSQIIQNIIRSGIIENQIKAEQISINHVMQAQLGVQNVKRNQLSYRLYLARKNGLLTPSKRVIPSKKKNILTKKNIELEDKMQNLSKELFLKYYSTQKLDLNAFYGEINYLINDLKRWKRIGFSLRLLKRWIGKAGRILVHD